MQATVALTLLPLKPMATQQNKPPKADTADNPPAIGVSGNPTLMLVGRTGSANRPISALLFRNNLQVFLGAKL